MKNSDKKFQSVEFKCDGIFDIDLTEIQNKNKDYINQILKNKIRDIIGEDCQVFLNLKNITVVDKKAYVKFTLANDDITNDIAKLSNIFHREMDEEFYRFPPIIPRLSTPDEKNLIEDYANLRKAIPTKENMEKLYFEDCLKFIKYYSLKKIKSSLKIKDMV